MARLLVKRENHPDQVIELKLGANHFGRTRENDCQIEHATISSHHCEVILSSEGLTVRDCGSTNGTFLNGLPIQEATLEPGHTLRLGDVEMLVESTDFQVAIPKFDVPRPAPPVVLQNGKVLCPRHPKAVITHQCTKCREVMCEECVHTLRRRGGKTLRLCPICSGAVEALGPKEKKRRNFFALLQRTVKLPFTGARKQE
jgi:hypothetical protein